MGKAKSSKRPPANKGPYDRPSAKPAGSKNPIFKYNTKIGQHILKNGDIAERIVVAAGIEPYETVLEVGPGTGVLTLRMLERAKTVVAVELDPRMAAELSCRVQGTPRQKKLRVILGDVIKLGNDEIPEFDVCVSNTPYQISSPLIFKLLALPKPPRTAILMLQREFALRLVARPGDTMYSRLSVNAQFFSRVSMVIGKVKPVNFSPPPQVDSSVVRLEPRTDRPAIAFEEFDGLLRICFGRKNKTIHGCWAVRQIRQMMVRNWVTWASLHPEKVSERDKAFLETGDAGVGDDVDEHDDVDMGDEDGGMELDEPAKDTPKETPGSLTVGGVQVPRARVEALVRAKTERVFTETEMGGKRAAKLDEADFLRLLFAFNEEGLHFS